MTFQQRTRALTAAAALTAALAFAGTGYAGSAVAAPVPAPTPTVADPAARATIAVKGPAVPGSSKETLHGTLRVEVTEPVMDKGNSLSANPSKTTYSVITTEGKRVPIAGDIPSTVKTGATFDGTVSLPAGQASPSITGATAPLTVATATITPSPIPAAHNHTIDLVTIDPAGVTPLDTSTYTDTALWNLSNHVGSYWDTQSQNDNTDVTKEVFFNTPTTVTRLQSNSPCNQSVDTLWDQAALALGYTSAQDYLDTPPAPDYGHQLVVLLPPGCQNDWTGIGTIGDGIGSSGLIEVTLGLGIDNKLLAHEIGTNLGIGPSDLAFCGRTTAGPNCTTYAYGDLYDVMGAASTDDDMLMNLNARTRTLLGWHIPDDVVTYALAAGEGSHTWTVRLNPYGSRATPEIIQLTDPGTQQTYYLEDRFEYEPNLGPAFYVNRPVYAMDAEGNDLVSMPPGYRLITGTPENGSLMITEPDSNFAYNDATGGTHTTWDGVVDQNVSVQNPTGTITATDVPEGVEITLKAPRPRLHDYSGDGHPDLLARNSAGALFSYHANGTGGWSIPTATQVGSGWNGMTSIVTPGDFDGDGHPDILARDSSGTLWLYPGNGTGGWAARRAVGSGWNIMTKIVGVGDFNGDGTADVLATDTSGRLFLYPGNGRGGWLAPSTIGSGWAGMIALLGIGDFNGDGQADLLAEDATGALWLYPHTPSSWNPRIQVGSGWRIMTQILSIGDFDGNGTKDVVATDASGSLWLYRGTGASGFNGRALIGSGWGVMTWLG